MEKSLFAGITVLAPGESLATDDFSFQSRDRRTIDRLLEIGAVTHRHDAHAALANPAVAPSGSVEASGGAIPADQLLYIGYTLLDHNDGETVVAPLITLVTPAALDPPASSPTVVSDYTGGSLPANTYYYAVTLTDAAGGETPLSDAAAVEREPGFASGQVQVSGLTDIVTDAGATGWRLWRATGGGVWYLLASGNTDTYTDDGTNGGDCTVAPPTDFEGTTNSTNLLNVTVPLGGAMASASGYAIYCSTTGDFDGPSLLGTYPAASAGTEHTFTALNLADVRPPAVSTSIPGASKIDPDVELLDWHWKRPVAASGDLPTAGTEEGDVRIVTTPIPVPYVAVADEGPWQPLLTDADIAIGEVSASGSGSVGPAQAIRFIGAGGLTAAVAASGASALVTLTAGSGSGGGSGTDEFIGSVAASGSGTVAPASALMFEGSGGTAIDVREALGSAIVRIAAASGAPGPAGPPGEIGLQEVAASGSGSVAPASGIMFVGSGATVVQVLDDGDGSARVVITSTDTGGADDQTAAEVAVIALDPPDYTATNVQDALAEIVGSKAEVTYVTDHIINGGHEADQISIAIPAPTGLSATNVQAALAEILSERTAAGKGVAIHEANASYARPTGYASIEWIGSVEPTNATDYDTWIDTA